MMRPASPPTHPSIVHAVDDSPTAHIVWERGCAGSLLGSIIGSANALLVSMYLVFPSPWKLWIAVGIGGLIGSAFQGAFLRPYIRPSALWVTISGLSWFGLSVCFTWLASTQAVVGMISVGLLASGLVSIGQYILIRHHFPSAWWWIVMNMILGAMFWTGPLMWLWLTM